MKILKEYYLIANDRTGDKYLIKKYTMSEEKHTFVPLNIFARNKSKILNKLHLRRCTNTTSYRSSKIRCCNSKKKKKKNDMLMIAPIIVLLLIILNIFYFLYLSHNLPLIYRLTSFYPKTRPILPYVPHRCTRKSKDRLISRYFSWLARRA